MYMNGTLRSWIHYCEIRMAEGTQKEHREVAKNAWDEIRREFPSLGDLL
jgi:thymidylate synthase (FAD)